MRNFEYEAPVTLESAIQQIAAGNGSVRALAGGTDLIDHIRTGRLKPDLVVDLKKIPELNVLELSADGLRLGASVSCARIYGDEEICRDYSALTDSCNIIGGIQVQNRASVGGNLCNSGPAADSIPALIALNAICVISGPNGTRKVAVADFCTAPSKNVLESGEILTELVMPARPANSGSHYLRFIPRNEMDIAVVGVGASVTLDESGEKFLSARIGVGAVAPTPLFAEKAGELLAGLPVNEESINKAAEAAQAIATPIDDMRGTIEFRKHVTGVLTKRALQVSIERARQQK
ncbi:Nicotinate dehydrogenase FAD-subunit [Polystyrenella longa]|uniref:Nicotinate dehydrogenase FAD-subunit n=1 Tax=Polystyrenella longa TaxID=2528007 RepID=A0A518CKH0_9PLAN|nr:xanthine dehydrogenase family protein subunit M [Polystyrenella longa]QDU79717.1 Nicotinate dehydrogenase FAD-subunit [Polystyrenella longa]